ncbi:MAG: DUF1854 domain-containing protein [Pirellulales bacterium]
MTRPHSQPVTPPRFRLEQDERGRLLLIAEDGLRHSGVSAVRMFPISSPEGPISLCDSRGREITWLPHLDQADPATRQLLEEHLIEHDFIPQIVRIYQVSSLSEPCEWDVETDRGRTRFVLKSEEDFHRLGPHRAIVVDARGLRFLLSDVRQLDAASRRFAEWWGL